MYNKSRPVDCRKLERTCKVTKNVSFMWNMLCKGGRCGQNFKKERWHWFYYNDETTEIFHLQPS